MLEDQERLRNPPVYTDYVLCGVEIFTEELGIVPIIRVFERWKHEQTGCAASDRRRARARNRFLLSSPVRCDNCGN